MTEKEVVTMHTTSTTSAATKAVQATVIVITGASRGLGRSIAISFAKIYHRIPLDVILIGRNVSDLDETNRLMKEKRGSIEMSLPMNVHSIASDLCDLKQLPNTIESIFAMIDQSNAVTSTNSSFLLINNAGSLGDLNPVGHTGDDSTREARLLLMSNAIDLNVTSSCFLTSECIRKYFITSATAAAAATTTGSVFSKVAIINISSLAAIQEFPSWGTYCAGKAARNMYHRVLAAENKQVSITSSSSTSSSVGNDSNRLKVLNYAPGPLDTDMQKGIRENPNVDKATQEMFIDMKTNNSLVDITASSDKLVKLLLQDSYESGSHIDYFDEVVFNVCECGCVSCTCDPCLCKVKKFPQCDECMEEKKVLVHK